MEPLTTAALVLGGAKLLGGAIEGFGQNQALAPSEVNQDRITELERLQQADALSLTGQERQAFVQAFMNPQRALQAEQMSQQQALQATLQDSGEAMRRLRNQEEQQQRALGQANTQIEMLNQEQARMQERELFALQQAEEQRARAREAALFSMIGGGVSDVGSLAGQTIAANELTGNAGQYDAQTMMQLGAMYGYQFPIYPTTGQPFTQQQMMVPPGGYGYFPGQVPNQPILPGVPGSVPGQ